MIILSLANPQGCYIELVIRNNTFNKSFKSYTYSLGVYFLDDFEIVEMVETGSANDGNGDILGVDHVSKRERGVDSATCFQNASVLCQLKEKKKKLGLR